MFDIKGVYTSIDALIEKLSYWGFPKDKKSYTFDSEESVLYSGCLVDTKGDIVEEGDRLYDAWVSGNIDLYSATLYCKVNILYCKVNIIDERPMTDEDAKEFGIPLY